MLRTRAWVVVGVWALASCGQKKSTFIDDGGVDSSVIGEDSGMFDDASLSSDAKGDGGSCIQCSSDLHDVLDCDGNVIMKCPPDKGCAPDGTCVPACDSAKANKSTIGCDYYTMMPVNFGANRSCFAAYVANTWGAPVSLGVDYNGQQLNVSTFAAIPQGSGTSLTYQPLSGMLPAGGIAILFLSVDSGGSCPLPTGSMNADFAGTGIGKAFHITSTAPVVAYDIFPYGGGSSAIASATLLLPTTAWGDNYMSTTAYIKTFTDPWIAIVAQENMTNVTISPTVDVVGGNGVAPTNKGVPKTYTIQKGEVLKFQQATDLSGTPVQATKPIGVWAGNPCTDFPMGVQACDGMHQQIPPIKALGNEYAAVRHRDRYTNTPEKAYWRYVGAVDGTTLSYDPPQQGAPTALKSGEVILYEADGQFVVKSQDAKHPFYFAEYMTGCTRYWNNSDCRGDPEFVNVIPPAQYLASYIFFTNPTYPTTHLVFVRKKTSSGFKDVTLDCAGTLTGWKPVGGSGQYEYTRTDLINGNFQKVGNCDNGRHEAKSAGPFGLTVWGWGEQGTSLSSQACSYAYPAGASVQPINTVVVPPDPK